MVLLDSICRICMQQDLLLSSIQPLDEKMAIIYDLLFKSACVQMVCSPCEQELRRSYRFFSLCRGTSEALYSVRDKDIAICVEPPNRDKVDVTPEVIDFADKDEETPEDLDYYYTYNDSVVESTDEVDFENWPSKIDKVVDLTLEKEVEDKVAKNKPEDEDSVNAKDADKVEVSLNVEKADINIEKNEERKGVPQLNEDIKIEISDHELELVKEEPPIFITSEQSNDFSDVIETALISLPKIVIPKIKCYPCGLCEEAFVKETARQQHVRENHQKVIISGRKTLYKCEICHKKFATRCYLNLHFKFHTGRNLFECYTCQKKFVNKAILTIHVRKHLQAKEFECERCKMRFNHLQSIRKHKQNVCGKRSEVECKICSRVVHKRSLTSHMKLHERPEYYTCRLCNRSFDHMYKLRNHVQTHTGEKRAQCDVCKLKFTQKHSLIAHMRIHNGERPFKCDLCDSAFTMVGNLQRHMKVHSEERPYKCDICGRTYKDETNLNYHKIRHKNIRPHSCTVCDKAFFTSTELRDHLTTHTGEKPYKCDICPRTFACEKYLKTHVRRHENPPIGHKCDICNATIKFRVNFLKHLRAHTDKTRFTCDICGQHYSSNDYLKEHRKLHFGIKALQCQCGEHFIVKKKFRDHLRLYPDHKLVKGSLKRLKRLSKKSL